MMSWQYFARYNITTCRMRQRILFRPETCLEMGLANEAANLAMGRGNDAERLRTASVRQDHRQDCVLVLRTHPVGAVVLPIHTSNSGSLRLLETDTPQM